MGGDTGFLVVCANSADTFEKSRCLKLICSSSAALLITLNASIGRLVRPAMSEKEVGGLPGV